MSAAQVGSEYGSAGYLSPDIELLLHETTVASASARSAWVVLIALEAYFFIALAGISHRDLLLNTPVAQPILQVSVPLRSFMLFGPLVLLVMHAGILQQHAILARKLKALDQSLSAREPIDLGHPARLRVHSYYLAQIEAGPETSPMLRGAFRLMDWLFLRLLPVGLLLAFQITYLPVHDAYMTGWHRAFIAADLIMLASYSLYLRGLSHDYADGRPARMPSMSGLLFGTLSGLAILAFCITVATIPGEWLDRTLSADERISRPVPYQGLGNVTRSLPIAARGRRAFWPTAYLFEGEIDDWTLDTTSLFSRNLIVMDEDLVSDTDPATTETSISLRGRDLNFATFDRSDLHRADLTDSSLKGASLIETNLEKARLVRVRMQGADLILAKFNGITAEAVLLDGARICEGETPLPLEGPFDVERIPCNRPQP